jgi:hypothetical protein
MGIVDGLPECLFGYGLLIRQVDYLSTGNSKLFASLGDWLHRLGWSHLSSDSIGRSHLARVEVINTLVQSLLVRIGETLLHFDLIL